MQVKIDASGNKYVETSYSGYDLLNHSRLNKGTGFTQEERDTFELHGILPPCQFTLVETEEKCYHTLLEKTTDLEKHIYLRGLQDRDETLFYAVIDKHIEEVLPLVYTPVVGEACQAFSHIYRRARGIYVSYADRERMDQLLSNSYFDNAEVIVVSDGERILGLGDQGVGGMGIPIGKLSLYTACAGIAPEKTLPILLDSGTDNQELLNDPLYIGSKHKRIRGAEYDAFVDLFIKAVKKRFPRILVQWEDFAQINALTLLNRYKDELCSFNDDIQGTAAITVSSIIASIKASTVPLAQQRIVLVGAGSAGVGISNLLIDYMESQGIAKNDAYAQLFLVDRNGLLTDKVASLDFQQPFVKNAAQQLNGWVVHDWENITLLEVVTNAVATAIVGVSAQAGIFTEQIIKQMALHSPHPIVFPLSNPTAKAEAKPQDVLDWTNGLALVGTGSPFPLAMRNGKLMRIDQVNNCYIFPGMGLGVLAVKSRRVTKNMFLLAAIALSELSPAVQDPQCNLLPSLSEIKHISQQIAFVVAKEAISCGLSDLKPMSDTDLSELIATYMWHPEYLPYRRI